MNTVAAATYAQALTLDIQITRLDMCQTTSQTTKVLCSKLTKAARATYRQPCNDVCLPSVRPYPDSSHLGCIAEKSVSSEALCCLRAHWQRQPMLLGILVSSICTGLGRDVVQMWMAVSSGYIYLKAGHTESMTAFM